ncbi:HpcH/HpaI aldolase/citrate lyase family protein [Pseudotabrizicola algicola]|uniref:CoA ester lyase n=1 Tax=Pseudotabrizicola algicola TaxID=2709381 RepID=A0A6B3RZV7_9RHOB|nr:CoA ester lyase [Pseudotabrizicola algicola]NEX48619.1 CoA ester lyase [Pseudotabrizicola algicola]
MPFRPRRSALYMPGSNPRALEKARSLPADVVILDLEDSVAPDEKAKARDSVLRAVAEGGFGTREVVVRVNGLDTPWGKEDLAAFVGTQADAVLVPKVSSRADVVAVQAGLGAGRSMAIWAMMETPQAILAAAEIASARAEVPGFAAMVMGTNDLAKETRATLLPGRRAFQPWLATCLIAARSSGLDIIDGVFNDLEDAAGFEAECRQGREMGFDGKTLIHPRQIEPCNQVFSPGPDELAWAERIAHLFDLPENQSLGVVRLEGRMVERLHAEMAQRMLATVTRG